MAYLQLPLVGTPGPAGPAGGGLAAVEDDLTPRLGGNLDGNSKTITAIGTINAVDITAHAARHKGGGADVIDDADGSNSGLMPSADFTKLSGIAAGATNTPLTAATPAVSLASVGTVGAGTDVARDDHRHQVATATVVTIGTANAAGSATSMARSDHVHSHGAQTVDSMHALAVANVSAGFLSGADKNKLDTMAGTSLSNLTPEINLASAGAAGSSSDASRGDHRHQMSVGSPVAVGAANADGSATSTARSDHVHAHGNQAGAALHAVAVAGVSHGFISSADQTKLDGIATGATNLALSAVAGANVSVAAAIAGVGTDASRFDHTHQVQAGTPVAVGSANADGTATTLARSDHVHNHGNQGGGTTHADAVAGVSSGFLSASDKTKLDGVSSNAPLTFVSIVEEFIMGYAGGTWTIGNFGWYRRSTGTGNVGTSIDGDADHPGIYQMRCGTSATALSCVYLAGISSAFLPIQISGGEVICTWVIQQTGVAANQARVVFGLGDIFQTNADQNNGVYFELDAADTNWFLVSNTAGTKTRRDTAIAYTTGNWIQLKFTINAAGTSIQANVNGTNAGAAITTNIPTAAKLGLLAKTDGSGVDSTTTNLDFCQLEIARTNNRYD